MGSQSTAQADPPTASNAAKSKFFTREALAPKPVARQTSLRLSPIVAGDLRREDFLGRDGRCRAFGGDELAVGLRRNVAEIIRGHAFRVLRVVDRIESEAWSVRAPLVVVGDG